jgi:hypothetical protein
MHAAYKPTTTKEWMVERVNSLGIDHKAHTASKGKIKGG